MKSDDTRVVAIRNNKLVGRGTCTGIDECWEDSEIVKALDEEGITTPEQAIKWALEVEGLRHEQALNCRWGEDTDPEVKAKAEWDKRVREAD